MNETSVMSCDGTIHNSLLTSINQVRNIFKRLGQFSGNIFGSSFDWNNNKQYNIRFIYGNMENCPAHDITENDETDSIVIGAVRFKYIRKFGGGQLLHRDGY